MLSAAYVCAGTWWWSDLKAQELRSVHRKPDVLSTLVGGSEARLSDLGPLR
jgi:hypothetical protein